jgi:hypothetical protein
MPTPSCSGVPFFAISTRGLEDVSAACVESERFLVASGGRGPYPHTDAGVEVRRIFHKLRHVAIENFNEHFKAIFDAHGRCPRKGRPTPPASRSGRFSSTNSRCSTATSRIRTPTAG